MADIICYKDFVLNLGIVQAGAVGLQRSKFSHTNCACWYVCPDGGSIDCDVATLGKSCPMFQKLRQQPQGIKVRDERDIQPMKTEATCIFETTGTTCRLVKPINVCSVELWGWHIWHICHSRAHIRTVNSTDVFRNCNIGLHKKAPTKFILILYIYN
jgi:hypothetical protein